MWISPLYSMKPSFLNLFMNILTRDRVVPIISANISCDTLVAPFEDGRRAIVCEQQQRARQPFLAGVEELVDQVFLDSYVSREHSESISRQISVAHLDV
jgi:hypothetical protein